MTIVAAVLLLVAALVAMRDWRAGMLAAIFVGFLADPIRKMLPGEPVVMVVAVGLVFGIAALAFLTRHGLAPVRNLALLRAASRPLELFVLWAVIAGLATLVRHQSPALAGIGLMSYMAPLPALVLAYYFGRDLRLARRWILCYVALCVAMHTGTYLDFLGVEWRVLEQVGEGLVIYDLGGILDAHVGFFRSPEVAAWHAATASCLLAVLLLGRWIRIPYWMGGLVIAFLLGAGLLTGRRKIFAVVFLFVCVLGFLLLRYRKGTSQLVSLALLVGGISVFGLSEMEEPTRSGAQLSPYVERTKTVFEDAPERLRSLGLGSISWGLRANGPLGGGAGVASQGAQHFGGGGSGAGEGGLGKIAAELGLPGLFLTLWMAFALARHVRLVLARAGRTPAHSIVVLGLFSLLAANVPAFIVASQVFGDLFVLLVLGLLFGFLLAIADTAARQAAAPAPPQTSASTPRLHAAREPRPAHLAARSGP